MFGMSIIEQLSVQIEMGMAVVSPPHAAVVVQVDRCIQKLLSPEDSESHAHQ